MVAITSQFSSVSVEIVIASLAIFNWLHIAENKIKICRQVPQGGGELLEHFITEKSTRCFFGLLKMLAVFRFVACSA